MSSTNKKSDFKDFLGKFSRKREFLPDVPKTQQKEVSPKKTKQCFNGKTEEEILSGELVDHLAENLDIVIVGINPGRFSAHEKHYYAGPGNHIWKCLFESKLIPEEITWREDHRLLEFGIGLTNIVSRATRGSSDLSNHEIEDGAEVLRQKLQKYKPKIVAFNGKGIYEIFSGVKNPCLGRQKNKVYDCEVFVMPSSSARSSHLPKAEDKLPFYVALRKLKDHLNGIYPELTDHEVCFQADILSKKKKK